MTGAAILDIARDGILTFLKVAAPLMLIALAVGLVVSLLQALTQIQEQTLIFVPKILAVFATMLLTLPFMGDALAGYMPASPRASQAEGEPALPLAGEATGARNGYPDA